MRDANKELGTLIRALAIATLAALVNLTAAAQTAQTLPAQPQAQNPTTGPATVSPRLIVVSIPDRKLVLMQDGAVKKMYPVAVGKPSTPSPAGHFTIIVRVTNPTYSHRGKIVAPGPGNPVGSRWMGLSTKGYGIHGTNEPGSIGKAASHGCIRMAKIDLEDLFNQVKLGDSVEIHEQRDATVEQVLGGSAPSIPVMPAPVAVANSPLLAGNVVAQSLEATAAGGQN